MKNTVLLIIMLFAVNIFHARNRDVRVREYITPQRIVWQKDGNNISDINILLKEGNGQAEYWGRKFCRLSSAGGAKPAFLLDFGKELHGGIQIVTGLWEGKKPVKVRIRYGESVSEAMSEIAGKGGATNDHAMRDQIVSLPWCGVYETGNSGFRFVRIDLLDEDVLLDLKEVRAISVMRDIEYKGSFRCNDERLNKIWETGAYTVHLNMQDYLWDGIKRDRLVWIGDMYPEVMTINTVFGYNEVVPKSLDLMRDITPLPGWMNDGYSSYSMWWLICHYDWFRYQGDLSYLKEQRDYITGLLKLLISKVGTDGKEQLDGIRFLDWPSNENPEAVDAGLQALLVWSMRAGKFLCDALGEKLLAEECVNTEKKLISAASLASKEFFKTLKSPYAPGTKQAVSLMALSDLMDKNEADKKYLSVGGAKGFSTFYGYYMLEAMAAAGNYAGAMDIISSYWGAMIDLGATSFWEDFNVDWLPNAARIDELVPEGKKDIHGDYGAYCYVGFRHSLCHGWASGPTSWLSRHVLGVEVVSPGCKEVRITPHLGNLKWVKGTFPTPYGVIKIRHEKQPDGKIKSMVDVPEGVSVIK